MPYITKEARTELSDGREPLTTGELNYLICRVATTGGNTAGVHRVIGRYRSTELQSYDRLNDIMGALDGARREIRRRADIITHNAYTASCRVIEHVQEQFYRETVAPYEDQAIKRNGDIFQ